MTEEPKGMGGWLLVFTITLTLRPLLGVIGALGALVLMVNKPGSELVLGLFALATVALAAYSSWMAYAFWRLRPNAVALLRRYFGTLLAYSVFIAAVRFVPHGAVPETTRFMDTWPRAAIAGVVYIAAWTTYFRKSQRVANTFGQPVAAA